MENSLTSVVNELMEGELGMAAVPLALAAIGILVVFILTRLCRKAVEKLKTRAEAEHLKWKASELQTQVPFFRKILLEEGSFFLETLKWIRWFFVAIISMYAVSLLLSNFADFAHETNFLKARGLSKSLRSFYETLNFCLKSSFRIFTLAIMSLWVARLIERGSRYFIARYLYEADSIRGKLRSKTLNTVASYIIRVAVAVIVVFTVLQSVGIDVRPLLATAGVVSFAIGFGAQSLVKDVLSGFFFLLEDQFAVGDHITIGAIRGKVEIITLRVTRIRTVDGDLLIIPNGEIRQVQNHTSGWAGVDFQIAVPLGTDTDICLNYLSEEATSFHAENQTEILETPQVLGIERVTETSFVLRVLIKTSPHSRWQIGREFNRRVLFRFKKEGIFGTKVLPAI
jgi:small-conductance mechanosensitive channel